ncbi:Hypp9352 [Branchiostoma lanceolatum]|uniref:Hypp9352 protein n=1 Tax=Branchiostoma lanceolatum TaxID=7740 RepID=A0A8S4MLE8_BRALA|nr:Hypp9352 [Branchiostoma lanceolatum]
MRKDTLCGSGDSRCHPNPRGRDTTVQAAWGHEAHHVRAPANHTRLVPTPCRRREQEASRHTPSRKLCSTSPLLFLRASPRTIAAVVSLPMLMEKPQAPSPESSLVASSQPDGTNHPTSEVVSRNLPQRDNLNKPVFPPAQAPAQHHSSIQIQREKNTTAEGFTQQVISLKTRNCQKKERKNTTAEDNTQQVTSLKTKKLSEEFRLSEGTNRG